MRKGILILLIVAVIAALYLWFNPSHLAALRGAIPEKEQTLYRWRGAQGQWVVSDRRPPDDREYEEIRYDSETNVVPAVSD